MFINQIGDLAMWFYILAFHWCVIIWVTSRLWANIANRDVSFNIPDWTIRSVSFFICRILRDGVGWNHSVYIDFQRGPWNRAPLRSPCFTESSMASRFVTSSPSIASRQNNIREIVPVFFYTSFKWIRLALCRNVLTISTFEIRKNDVWKVVPYIWYVKCHNKGIADVSKMSYLCTWNLVRKATVNN